MPPPSGGCPWGGLVPGPGPHGQVLFAGAPGEQALGAGSGLGGPDGAQARLSPSNRPQLHSPGRGPTLAGPPGIKFPPNLWVELVQDRPLRGGGPSCRPSGHLCQACSELLAFLCSAFSSQGRDPQTLLGGAPPGRGAGDPGGRPREWPVRAQGPSAGRWLAAPPRVPRGKGRGGELPHACPRLRGTASFTPAGRGCRGWLPSGPASPS